eukprot:gnl/MRDRNA2_/MRDRNA2_95781_c0_seq1.p1 gnl/MRDRNA2_/MRDRNA2_95781_c0~~gnl/MRDRNA2_/MRDRNA2_95781_c0_seq1.p1  ORF type:complete len:150 (+),score=27.43 gnl/MRDRNA2_/MRDRNA2_95781_c0_seq1:94-543(+)
MGSKSLTTYAVAFTAAVALSFVAELPAWVGLYQRYSTKEEALPQELVYTENSECEKERKNPRSDFILDILPQPHKNVAAQKQWLHEEDWRLRHIPAQDVAEDVSSDSLLELLGEAEVGSADKVEDVFKHHVRNLRLLPMDPRMNWQLYW